MDSCLRTCLAVVAIAVSFSGTVKAEAPITDVRALHGACRDAERTGPRELYVVEVRRWRFGEYDREHGVLVVDTRRNLRVLGGAAEILPTGLETIGFVANRTRARELREREGSRLRLGFFLGFDGHGQPCVIRPAVSVTLVRADLAFVEMLDERGRVVAREDTERLRAWQDDAERDAIPGEGPRGRVEAGDLPGPLQATLSREATRAALARCHVAAVERGANPEARVVVRVEPEEARVAISSLGDEEGDACVLDVVRGALGAGASALVPVRFTAR